jgi:hypothetical protein
VLCQRQRSRSVAQETWIRHEAGSMRVEIRSLEQAPKRR